MGDAALCLGCKRCATQMLCNALVGLCDVKQTVSECETDLELLWVATAAGHCKGVGHVVPKAGVVGMLLNCHQLDGIVAQLGNPGQHVVCTVAAAKPDCALPTGMLCPSA